MIKITAVAAALLGLPAVALAAPFCMTVPNGTPQCIYVDGAQCAADAYRQNGYCDVNPAEVKLPTSRIGDYCLVMPNGQAICGYSDGIVCSRDGLREHGVCSKAIGTGPKLLPDPYAPNAGR